MPGMRDTFNNNARCWQALCLRSILVLSSVPPIAGAHWLDALKWLALVAVAVKLPRMVAKAAAALRCWVLDINALMSVAVAGTDLVVRMSRFHQIC